VTRRDAPRRAVRGGLVGSEIQEFVVGYGSMSNEATDNLPCIGVLKLNTTAGKMPCTRQSRAVLGLLILGGVGVGRTSLIKMRSERFPEVRILSLRHFVSVLM